MDSRRSEPLSVAGEHKARARRFGRRHLAIEAGVAGERIELQRVALALEQVAHFQGGHGASRTGWRTRRAGALSSCRRTLAAARSRAVRWSVPLAVPT